MRNSFERFGLQEFKKDHLGQYIFYLKGLQQELEFDNQSKAKEFYIDSLTRTMFVDHRIRKEALIRLITINKKLNPKKELIEKTFIQRYFIKQKYVQVILDASSFNNTKLLRQTMNLPKTIFNDLGGGDHFGFKVFKNVSS